MNPDRMVPALCLLLLWTLAGAAQQPTPRPRRPLPPAPPALETEEFLTDVGLALERTGTALVKGWTAVGTVSGVRGTAAVTSWEIIEAAGGGRVYGVSVAIRDPERPEQEEELAYVDYAELDPLLAGLDYILKLENSATRLARFEAQYHTRGGLSFYRFNTPNGYGTAVSIRGRRGPRLVLRPAGLVEFRDLLESARTIIDEARRRP